MKNFKFPIYSAIILSVALMLSGTFLASCRSAKPTVDSERITLVERVDTIVSVHRDTVRIETQRADSVVVRDSVFTFVRGDTVIIREYHWRESAARDYSSELRAFSDSLRHQAKSAVSANSTTVYRPPEKSGPSAIFMIMLLIAALVALLWLYNSKPNGHK